MRWYGALQEGPSGHYSVLLTDFVERITGGGVSDGTDHVEHIIGFIDHLIAQGDEVTIVSDRLRRIFRAGDPPSLWRALVARYSPEHYDIVHPFNDERAIYQVAAAAPYGSAPAVVLVEPGSLLALHQFITGQNPDALEAVRLGCRVAAHDGVLCCLQSSTLPPSSHDIYRFLASDFPLDVVAGSDILWAFIKSASHTTAPDLAQFHLQHAETVMEYKEFHNGLAGKLAALRTCQCYDLHLQIGFWGFNRGTPAQSDQRPHDERFRHEVDTTLLSKTVNAVAESLRSHSVRPERTTETPEGRSPERTLRTTPIVPLRLRDFPDQLWQCWKMAVDNHDD